MIKREIFYVSNLISFSRLVLLTIALYFLLNDKYFASALFIVLIWISDLLDGYVARKRNEISELGKIIDPLADKISIILLCIVLLMKNLVSPWFIAVLIIRDIAILIAGLYLKKTRNLVLQSNIMGKLSVFIIGFTLLFIIVGTGIKYSTGISGYTGTWELISNVLIFISLGMVILSLLVYYKRFLEFIK